MNQLTTKNSTAIVQAQGQDLFLGTNIMAELFGRPHRNLMRDLAKLAADGIINTLSLERIGYQDSRGREQSGYRLPERDAMVLMPFLGGKKSAQGQAKLVDEFMRMGTELRRIAARKNNLVLQLALKSKSVAAMLMTDCLLEARAALGKTTKPHHFLNEHSLCNWVLSAGYAHVDDTDLGSDDLTRLAAIRRRNAVLIVQGISYQKRKDALRDMFPLGKVVVHE